MGPIGSTPSGWPDPSSFTFCGAASLLTGPADAPVNAVTVAVGDDLAAKVAAAPAGTVFYILGGTHTLASGPVVAKANDQFIGAPGAVIDGQFAVNYTGNRSIAFKGLVSGVTIEYLTIKNFGQADGKMTTMVNQTPVNWNLSTDWTIAHNTISYAGGAGVWATDGSKVLYNCLENNEQYGVAMTSKGRDNTAPQTVNADIENNEIRGNNRSGAVETLGVCTGCAGGMKMWNSKGTTIRNNRVTGNNGPGIWMDNNNIDSLIEGNVVLDNLKAGIEIEISYNSIIQKNYVSGNYVTAGSTRNNFPNGGIYISGSGGDDDVKAKLGGSFAPVIDVNNNDVINNWNGILLWEDAGRYCSNNDTTFCPPLVTDTNSQCVTNLAQNTDICRWKTQNVTVHDNKFEMSSGLSWCPASQQNCGRSGINSNTGPAGTPYAGTTIIDAITKTRNNIFKHNTYVGNWHFSIPNGGAVFDKDIWQTTWKQDAGSTF